jgi:hypothetical protein
MVAGPSFQHNEREKQPHEFDASNKREHFFIVHPLLLDVAFGN